ncbi:MAG: peptidase T [Clostridia bacterium]|nr:peptidase T [Clostridia bacterium]
MSTVKEKFLRYIQIESTSDEACPECPSTPGQWNVARQLVAELQAMGVADARVDGNCYVYGTIPAKGDHPERIGLIAHMDTSDAVKGATHPQVIPCYEGGPITLLNGVIIDGFDFLPSLAGQELIVTDGTSVLGADDKAGVAEIMQLAQILTAPDAPEHCTVCIGFTPDEEIGRGADLFDIPGFSADWAYTVDGGALGELEYENFNAASCRVTVRGVNIHPGSAKNQMKNAALIAMEWNSLLPPAEIPAHTEKYEGFFHLSSMEGDEENATLKYIIRDHSKQRFEERKETCRRITAFINARYGEDTVHCEINDSYYNMREVLEQRMDIVDRAAAAFESAGVKPVRQPIRGGTDGARLSYMGLLCPNLSTGGYNFHGRKELIPVPAMEKMVEVLLCLVGAQQ